MSFLNLTYPVTKRTLQSWTKLELTRYDSNFVGSMFLHSYSFRFLHQQRSKALKSSIYKQFEFIGKWVSKNIERVCRLNSPQKQTLALQLSPLCSINWQLHLLWGSFTGVFDAGFHPLSLTMIYFVFHQPLLPKTSAFITCFAIRLCLSSKQSLLTKSNNYHSQLSNALA